MELLTIKHQDFEMIVECTKFDFRNASPFEISADESSGFEDDNTGWRQIE